MQEILEKAESNSLKKHISEILYTLIDIKKNIDKDIREHIVSVLNECNNLSKDIENIKKRISTKNIDGLVEGFLDGLKDNINCIGTLFGGWVRNNYKSDESQINYVLGETKSNLETAIRAYENVAGSKAAESLKARLKLI